MKNKIKTICCIGAGYVGGPTMSVIADRCPHIEINVVDTNKQRIEEWNKDNLDELPIFEPGLDELVKRCRGRNLHFSNKIEENISKADMIFISVNTPTKTKGRGAGKASDLKWVEASARQIAKYANGETIVVEKSTLPVRTAQTIKTILESYVKEDNNDNQKEAKKFFVLSNPEFLSEGTAINDLENPDRVLIGGDDINSIKALEDIYLNWVSAQKILTTDLWSSELSKLIANAFLAQRISSINSITALCEATGADINNVALAIGTDKRIGEYFLKAGPGFGGSCFKKDIMNLIYICNYYGLHQISDYWQQVVSINNWQQKRIVDIVIQKLFGTLSAKKITILGFAFKANTNDTRESPAINICKELLEEDCILNIYDPKVSKKQISKDLDNFDRENSKKNTIGAHWEYKSKIYEAFQDTDAVIIITEWDEFRNLDWLKISKLMRKPAWIFDTRSIINVPKQKIHGINFWQIGTCNDL